MDRALSKKYLYKQRLKKGAYVLAIGLAILGSIGAFRFAVHPEVSGNMLNMAVVEKGSIELSTKTSGIVFPKFERALTSPISSTIEQVYQHAGNSISKGTPILKLNKEFSMLEYEKLKDGYELKNLERTQKRLETEKTLIDLKGEQATLELEVASLQKKIKRAHHRFEAGLITEAEFWETELPLKTSEAELERLTQQIQNEEALLASNLKALDLEIHIQEKRIHELERQLEMADTPSTQEGVITWVNDKIGATVQPGEVIARVANLNSFRVEASISDRHGEQLQIGGLVRVRASGNDLTGHIAEIRPAIKNGVISFIVVLDQANHAKLRPQLRVDVFVIHDSQQEVLRVRNGVYFQKIKDFVFLQKENRLLRRSVQLGKSNYDYVEILSGLEEGDQIVISDMESYQTVDELNITQ